MPPVRTLPLTRDHSCLPDSQYSKVNQDSDLNVLAGYKNLMRGDSAAQLLKQCKQLARDVKSQRPHPCWLPAQLHDSIPSTAVVDELIRLYFTTFESCYRILHYPSFQADYESYLHQPLENESFFPVLLLVISAAGVLHSDADVRREITIKVPAWIYICQGWLSAPLEKDRLTLRGIQISCLLLLVRQVNRIGADIVWISTGSLLRMAMQMGLHQDPMSLKRDMDLRQVELRRRLWFTILEMNVQATLDSGMSPMITDRDWTTQPPSDLSDADLEPEENRRQWEDNPAASARALFQHVLAQSITLRLEVARVINSLQEEPSYDEVLLLSSKLKTTFHQAAVVLEGGGASLCTLTWSNQFAFHFCAHLLRRFLLCLHFPYALKAKQIPTYAHSQKVSLDISQELVSLLSGGCYAKVLIHGGGMFRDIITRGALVIYLELNSELEELSLSDLLRQRSRARQMALMKDIHKVLQYSKDRLHHGNETSVKGYFFLSIASAQLEAQLGGRDIEDAMAKAAEDSLVTCQDILRMKLDSSKNNALPEPIPWAVQDTKSPPASADFCFGVTEIDALDYSDIFQAWTDGKLGQTETFDGLF